MSKAQLFTIMGAAAMAVLLFLAPKVPSDIEAPTISSNDIKVQEAVKIMHEGVQPPMKGISMLLEVIEEEPDHLEANFHLGMFSMQSGQFDKAVKRLEKVLQLDANYTFALYYLGHAYANMGETEKALDSFEKFKAQSDDKQLVSEAEKYIKELKGI